MRAPNTISDERYVVTLGVARSPHEKLRSHPVATRHPVLTVILVMAAAATLLVSLTSCDSQPLTLGDILQNLTTDVNSVIANATTGAQSDVLVAAGSVLDAIDNTASAYEAELNQTAKQVNRTISSTLDQLQNSVNDLNAKTLEDLQTATNDSQQIINSLPFTNKNPQVTSYTPHFVAIGAIGGPALHVNVFGNFFYSAQPGLTPTLSINGTIIQADLLITNQLGFDVPASLLPTPGSGVQSLTTELTVPYQQRSLLGKYKGVDGFRLLLTILPTYPVSSLVLTTAQPGGTIQHNGVQPMGAPAAGGWHVASNVDCQSKTVVESFTPDPGGWHFIPSTVQVVPIFNKTPNAADWSVDAGTDHVVVTIHTTAHCFLGISNGSGDVTLYATYTEQEQTPPTQGSLALQIGWGDTISVPVTPGWTLKAKLFTGNEMDFNDTDTTDSYLHVVNHTDNITISAQFTNLKF